MIRCELAPSYDNYDVINSFIIEGKHVKGLNLYNLSLQGNFSSILAFTNLTFLSLVNTRIKTIPDSISLLRKIGFLDLGGNELIILPNSLKILVLS